MVAAGNHSVAVLDICEQGDEHRLCVPVSRGVPPDLRCESGAPVGYGSGRSGCAVPPDLSDRVERALRDTLEESRRRGTVLEQFEG